MSQVLKGFTDTHLTLLGFVIFFVLFVILIGSTFLSSQMKLHRELERLPLDDHKPEVER